MKTKDEKNAEASAELIRLAIRGALAEGVPAYDALKLVGAHALAAGLLAEYKPEQAPQSFRLTGAVRLVTIDGTITDRFSEDEPRTPGDTSPKPTNGSD